MLFDLCSAVDSSSWVLVILFPPADGSVRVTLVAPPSNGPILNQHPILLTDDRIGHMPAPQVMPSLPSCCYPPFWLENAPSSYHGPIKVLNIHIITQCVR